jgi:hypothetical protein
MIEQDDLYNLLEQYNGRVENQSVEVIIIKPDDPHHLDLITRRLKLFEEELPWFEEHDDFDMYGSQKLVCDYLKQVMENGFVYIECPSFDKDNKPGNDIRTATLMAGRWCRPDDIVMLEMSVKRSEGNLENLRWLKENYKSYDPNKPPF